MKMLVIGPVNRLSWKKRICKRGSRAMVLGKVPMNRLPLISKSVRLVRYCKPLLGKEPVKVLSDKYR